MDEFKSFDIKTCLAKARDLFSRAELAVKRYERIGLEAQIGAINELRYAGHHLMRASEGKSEKEIGRHALCAERHSLRALHDARDAALLVSLEKIDNYFNLMFTVEELKDALPDYEALYAEITSFRTLLENSPMAKNREDGDEVDQAISRLQEIRGRLDVIAPILAEKRHQAELAKQRAEQEQNDAEKREKQDRENQKALTDRRNHQLSVLLGVLGILASILGTVVGILWTIWHNA